MHFVNVMCHAFPFTFISLLMRLFLFLHVTMHTMTLTKLAVARWALLLPVKEDFQSWQFDKPQNGSVFFVINVLFRHVLVFIFIVFERNWIFQFILIQHYLIKVNMQQNIVLACLIIIRSKWLICIKSMSFMTQRTCHNVLLWTSKYRRSIPC